MENRSEARERFTEEQVLVRQVTHVQASWAERERGQAGAFTFQLILDQGVDEYILQPSAEDAEVLLNLFKISTGAFDRARKVLMFTCSRTSPSLNRRASLGRPFCPLASL